MSDSISRRDATKLIVAAPIAAPGIVKAAAEAGQVGYGLIGAGPWGQFLLSHGNAVQSGRCVAICDKDATRLARAVRTSRDHPQSYQDYHPLLGRQDIQAVVVATPPYTHFPIVRDALLAGKHVQCEPPLAFKAEEVHALRELISGSDRIVQVGLQRRFSKFYQTAKQMVSKGFIGDITNIQAQWHRATARGVDPNRSKESNWRYYREFSGGLTSELASHLMDIGDWMFNDKPDFVTGVGGLDWKRDGRDTYDNIALILRYPEGRQMIISSISTNKHLACLGGMRSECGEILIGTEGTVEITLGLDDETPLGLWFYEPNTAKVSNAADAKEIARVASATVASTPGGGSRGMPILLDRDQVTGDESFFQRELKFARRWLYKKGIALPEEDRHPVRAELEGFFECCLSGARPKANADVGLDNSAAVILSNLAMDQGRRVHFSEMARLGTTKLPRRAKG
jgi:predicted dehydrogenase